MGKRVRRPLQCVCQCREAKGRGDGSGCCQCCKDIRMTGVRQINEWSDIRRLSEWNSQILLHAAGLHTDECGRIKGDGRSSKGCRSKRRGNTVGIDSCQGQIEGAEHFVYRSTSTGAKPGGRDGRWNEMEGIPNQCDRHSRRGFIYGSGISDDQNIIWPHIRWITDATNARRRNTVNDSRCPNSKGLVIFLPAGASISKSHRAEYRQVW